MKRLLLVIGILPWAVLMAAGQQRVTVSGYVWDKESGESLIAAEVLSGEVGTVTNPEGRYSLSITPGAMELQVHYAGYRPVVREILLQRDTVIHFFMEPGEALEEATVSAFRETSLRSVQMGAMEVPLQALQKAPVVLGEADVLKTIQLLPGIQQGADGFSSLFIRGGGADENLFLLDGVSLYNVSHLLGLFSAFTPEAVKKATVYKGAFPARYGGRVSGIVDIRTHDGDLYSYHGSVNIGLLSGKLHLEGPVVKGKTAFSFSGRLMHTGLAAPILKWAGVGLNYAFYDISGKLSHRFSENDRLYLSVFLGQDAFRYDDAFSAQRERKGREEEEFQKMNWGNFLTALRWNHVFNGRWSMNSVVAFSRFGNTSEYQQLYPRSINSDEKGALTETMEQYTSTFQSGIRDLTLSADVEGALSPRHHLRTGISAIHHNYSPSTRFVRKTLSTDTVLSDLSQESGFQGWEVSLYAEDEIALFGRWTLLPGARIALMTSGSKPYLSLQPRISSRLGLPLGIGLKLGYARMGQYVHQVASSNISMPSDFWVPVTERIKPIVSDIVSFGVYYDGLPAWEFSLEAYAKHSDNVLDYRDGVSLFNNPSGWEDLVEMGESRSAGLEVYLQKKTGKLTGWLSYTLSRTERRFANSLINRGEWFPHKYDRRHVIHLYADYHFSPRVEISATWSFMSGGWMTMPDRTTAVLNLEEKALDNTIGRPVAGVTEYISSRNNYNLPPTHMLNVSLLLHKKTKKGERLWTLGLYNVYNAMNPNLVFMPVRTQNGDNEGLPIELRKVTFLPILPSVSYTYKF